MKKNVILCCVACCLLSAFPENKGSRLKDSLYCFMQYSKNIVTCSWSESQGSRQFVHMSLMDIDGRPVCDEREPGEITPTHLNWKCHINVSNAVYFQELHFIFLPDRSLESRLNVSNEGDEAKPKNLHCEVSGGIITCSWEVRQEVTDSVDFTLYYQKASGQEACQPRCWQKTPVYLFCACNFTADHKNSILLHNITVRPTDPETSKIVFKICKNVMLEPRILTVEERKKGETFEIGWKKQIEWNDHFKYNYELCYWREKDMKPNEDAVDCPGNNTLSLKDNIRVLRLANHLEPGSNYSVKVRVRLGDANPEDCYKGPWSEWSNVQTFHTKSVVSTVVLFILVLSAVVIFVICAVCGYRALIRYKKQWDDTIPNPSKSSIVKGLHKAKERLVIRYLTLQNGPSFPYEEHLYVEPYNNVLMQAPSTKDINLLKEDEEQVNWAHSELFQDDDSQCISLFKMTKEEYPTASTTEGYTPFSELVDEQNIEMDDSQFTFSAFDGPYLLS